MRFSPPDLPFPEPGLRECWRGGFDHRKWSSPQGNKPKRLYCPFNNIMVKLLGFTKGIIPFVGGVWGGGTSPISHTKNSKQNKLN